MTVPIISSLHVYPVKSLRGTDTERAVVEPWGLAGDRRWMLVDAATRTTVTQREYPSLARVVARSAADGTPGVVLSVPGHPTLRVPAPPPGRLETVRLFSRPIDVLPGGGTADQALSAWLGIAVRLVFLDEPAVRRPITSSHGRPGETVSFADAFPLLLTSAASLDALNTLVAAGDLPGEGPVPMNRFRPSVVVGGGEPWAEDGWRRVRIGEVLFRVAKPCARCVVTTTDQVTGVRGHEPLRTLGRHRKIGAGLLFGQNLVPQSPGTLRVGDPLTVVE